jgi:hypothetical protein
MSGWKKPSRPGNVPLSQPMPAINEENFNWKLWQTIKKVYDRDGQRDIEELQGVIGIYETMYKLLPADVNKRINFNALGIVLGNKYNSKKYKDFSHFAKAHENFLEDEDISNGLDKTSLIRYIEYFKKSK